MDGADEPDDVPTTDPPVGTTCWLVTKQLSDTRVLGITNPQTIILNWLVILEGLLPVSRRSPRHFLCQGA